MVHVDHGVSARSGEKGPDGLLGRPAHETRVLHVRVSTFVSQMGTLSPIEVRSVSGVSTGTDVRASRSSARGSEVGYEHGGCASRQRGSGRDGLISAAGSGASGTTRPGDIRRTVDGPGTCTAPTSKVQTDREIYPAKSFPATTCIQELPETALSNGPPLSGDLNPVPETRRGENINACLEQTITSRVIVAWLFAGRERQGGAGSGARSLQPMTGPASSVTRCWPTCRAGL